MQIYINMQIFHKYIHACVLVYLYKIIMHIAQIYIL